MLRECFNDFIGHLRLERGLSPRTAKAYGSDMELFIRYLESLHIDDWEEVRRDDISDFLEADKDHGMEPTTLARRLVSIKVFFGNCSLADTDKSLNFWTQFSIRKDFTSLRHVILLFLRIKFVNECLGILIHLSAKLVDSER